MRSLSECSNIETTSHIYREEKGKEINFRHELYDLVCDIISIDNCVFKNTHGEKSCDFLFLFDKSKQQYNVLKNRPSLAYYVELKGIGLSTACEQLLNSIEKTKDEITGFDINALVVSTRKFIPQYDNNEFYRGVKRLIKKNIEFEITPHTINL